FDEVLASHREAWNREFEVAVLIGSCAMNGFGCLCSGSLEHSDFHDSKCTAIAVAIVKGSLDRGLVSVPNQIRMVHFERGAKVVNVMFGFLLANGEVQDLPGADDVAAVSRRSNKDCSGAGLEIVFPIVGDLDLESTSFDLSCRQSTWIKGVPRAGVGG